MAFQRPEDIIDYWDDKLHASAETLGIAYVAAYDQKMIPTYPAVSISAGQTGKEVHATHTWLYTWRIQFYVLHADMTKDHRRRSKEEATMVTNLVRFLEIDKTLGDQVIFSYVETETPGVVRPFATPSNIVLSTRLDWTAASEGRF